MIPQKINRFGTLKKLTKEPKYSKIRNANDVIVKNEYFNPNPHCFIAITKATACG
jgi:hypothetical protein